MAPTKKLLALLICLSAALLASPSQAHDAALEGGDPKTALLFAYFRTESETLHYAVSRDGFRWVPLNNNEPVMTPTQGAASVR